MIVVRVDASGDLAFSALLDRVRRALLGAWEHQEVPFQKLVEVFADRRDAAVPPLYQLGFNYLSIGFSRASAAAEDDLMLEIAPGNGRIEYNSALFTAPTARWLADCYVAVLSAALADPQVTMSELDLPPRPAVRAHEPGPPATPRNAPGPVAPRTPAEELVAKIWASVLGRDRPGALDDFFELGGHSLLALRVIASLSAAAGVDLPIQSFFADTTVAGVAAEVERLIAAEHAVREAGHGCP
jgi:acyl carrier protein